MTPRWIAFYADGAAFSHLDGAPAATPRWGMVAIAQESEATGHRIVVGDYFLHVQGEWRGCDHGGMIDQLTHFGDTLQAFRLGRVIADADYAAVLSRATASDAIPPRSARSPYERAMT